MPSFFINFTQGDKILDVYGEEYHHIHRVFRYTLDDEIKIINGKGLYAKAKITEISKKYLRLELIDYKYFNKSEIKTACAFSLLKNKHDLLIIEKLTELGVSDLFPLSTRYSVKQSNDNTVDKFEKIAISAVKQCDNPYLPKVHNVKKLEDSIKLIIENGYIPLVASEIEKEKYLSDYLNKGKAGNYCILIGPEGGFHEEEFNLFERLNISQFCLGNHILRAETAAITAVSQLVAFNLINDKNWF